MFRYSGRDLLPGTNPKPKQKKKSLPREHKLRGVVTGPLKLLHSGVQQANGYPQ